MSVRANEGEGGISVSVVTDKIPQGVSVPGNGLGHVGAEGLDRSKVNEPVGGEAAREIGGGVGSVRKGEGGFSKRFVRMAIRHTIEIEGEVGRPIAGSVGGFECEGGLLDPGGGVGERSGGKPEIPVSVAVIRTARACFFGPDPVFGSEV